MKSQKNKKPELLAPAGSMESFHTAINAGADAVYLGLDVFNARLRAKNFTIQTLSYLMPYAHSKGVKVYVTLNTQIKQVELESLINVLFQLEQLGVDALIVADLGLIEIARSNFPSLRLHGSTQMAVHNCAGIKSAERLGLSRVVLARELTSEEIKIIRKGTSLQIEVFIHGALCYSISGMCLASSFLGGASGNRGMCTQACRRKFRQKSSEGYFFSPNDFCGIDYLPFFEEVGVCSLKIEGRMKGPEYVDTVVRAYRAAIDNPEKIPEMKQLLASDLGRPKTSYFLSGFSSEKIIDHQKPSGTGLLIGKILYTTQNAVVISGVMDLSPGDRLRIHPEDGYDGIAVNVIKSEIVEDGLHVEMKIAAGKAGDLVYLVSKKNAHEKLTIPTKINVAPIRFRSFCPAVKRILHTANCSRQIHSGGRKLWIKIDSTEWLVHLQNMGCQNVILSASKSAMQNFVENQQAFKIWKSLVWLALPPFISDNEMAEWNKLISVFISQGLNRFVCNNIGQSTLFPSGVELIADNPFWIINCASQKSLKKMGFKYFAFSTEDEYLNLKECISPDGILYVYSHIPLFISRLRYAVTHDETLVDSHDNSFFISEKQGLYHLLSRKPLCLTHRIDKMGSLGISNFLIDLSFIKPDGSFLRSIFEAYKSGTKVPGSSMFNFKAGLR
ncbi:MAG TPA: peptidase U32 family protein [Chitinispirillaceae bacterium]|nr:peptidase U32 family protein [Chitinispirillaceae bacterium]